MRRRLLPPTVAAVFGLAAASPLMTGWPDEGTANEWTLFAFIGMLVFTAVLFAWMRQRMHDGVRRLTRFGTALVDYFSGVVCFFVALAGVYAVAYEYARHNDIPPVSVRISERAVLIAVIVFVMATGLAVAWEMRKSGARLRVHEEDV